MKVLVTGGAGYIGSVVAQQLLVHGHQVVILDNLSSGHADTTVPGAQFVDAPLSEAHRVLSTGDGESPFDAVIHLAAKSLVGESVEFPERYWHGNIVATLQLIDAMRSAGVPRIVFSSTAAVYGNPVAGLPDGLITEDHPTSPINPYGASKLAIDHMLAAEARAHGLAAVSLRYFNVGGASGPLRERHDPETHLIPNLLKVATGERPHAELYGVDYPTADGTAIRDYIHVLDLAQAHLLAMEWIEPGVHEVFNLGTGVGTSVRNVIAAVEEHTGGELPVVERPRRPGDPAHLVASGEKARATLGWEPQHDIHAIVRDAAAGLTG